jgi:hypothetical protein
MNATTEQLALLTALDNHGNAAEHAELRIYCHNADCTARYTTVQLKFISNRISEHARRGFVCPICRSENTVLHTITRT